MSNTKYIIENKNILPENYELLYISKSKFENDWHSTAHFHPFTEIFYITNGSGSFYLDDRIVMVSEGDLVLINPNCLHTEKSSSVNTPLEYIVLGIDNLFLSFKTTKTLCNNVNDTLFKVINFRSEKKILESLNLLLTEVENKEPHFEILCKNILSSLIISIMRNTNSHLALNDDSKEKLNLECMKIKNYIDSHYSENLTLDYLAKIAHINKFYLVHSFTKQIGISPINYLINKRIEEAKSLLKTTNYSIRDISSIIGFSNSSYFSQIFKKTTGYSPNKYRNIN